MRKSRQPLQRPRHPSRIGRLPTFLNTHRAAATFCIVFGLVGISLIIWSYAATGPVPTTRYWIINQKALNEMSANPSARAALANDTLYVTAFRPDQMTLAEAGLHIVPTRRYTSAATFAQSIANGTIPSYVKAILYDNEPWPLTPISEQQNIVFYYKQADSLADAHGLLLIAAPVPSSYDALVAPYADIIDVQAQAKQATASTYVNYIRPRVQDSREANPRAIILSGISTNPTAGDPTAQQLLNIAANTFPDLVHGWWLNIPSPGIACPRCHQPRPGTAVSFLSRLGANTPSSNLCTRTGPAAPRRSMIAGAHLTGVARNAPPHGRPRVSSARS